MLDVLESTKQLYKESSNKALTISVPGKNITFTNGNIEQQSLELTEILETESELQFKGCNANVLKFNVAGLLVDIRDEYIEAKIQAGTSEEIPLFKGYVVSQGNRTYEDSVTELECYDVLYKIRDLDVLSWLNGLTNNSTIKQVRDSFFSYLNTAFGYDIEQIVDVYSEEETGALINDTSTITKLDPSKLPKTITAGEIIEGLCQVNARYGQIGRDGKFHYRKLREIMKGLYPSYETFPSETTYPAGENADVVYNLDGYSEISYEPYYVEKIDGVSIKHNDGNSTSYGSGTNKFNISDNIIAQMLNDKAQACQNIYAEVNPVWFIPATLKCFGYPWVECGDIILTRTRKNIVRTYVLERHLKGIQALVDDLEASGNQFREAYVESDETGISTNRNSNKVNADEISATKLRVGNIEADYIKTAQLNAVDAKIDNLSAIAITTQNLSAQSINASQITAGTISADRIASNSISVDKLNTSSLASWQLAVQQLTCTTLYVGGYRYSGEYEASLGYYLLKRA